MIVFFFTVNLTNLILNFVIAQLGNYFLFSVKETYIYIYSVGKSKQSKITNDLYIFYLI